MKNVQILIISANTQKSEKKSLNLIVLIELKKIYKKVMNNVSIYSTVNKNYNNDYENINITINIFISDFQYNL